MEAIDRTIEWDDDWGTRDDLGIDPSIAAHDGFPLGERITAKSDGDEDRHQFWFEGDEGQVIGFMPATKMRGVAAIVAFEGMDPMTSYDLNGDFDPTED